MINSRTYLIHQFKLSSALCYSSLKHKNVTSVCFLFIRDLSVSICSEKLCYIVKTEAEDKERKLNFNSPLKMSS